MDWAQGRAGRPPGSLSSEDVSSWDTSPPRGKEPLSLWGEKGPPAPPGEGPGWQPPTHPQVPPQELRGERGMKGNCRAGQQLPMQPGLSTAAEAQPGAVGSTEMWGDPHCPPPLVQPQDCVPWPARGSWSLQARGTVEGGAKASLFHDSTKRSQGHPPAPCQRCRHSGQVPLTPCTKY